MSFSFLICVAKEYVDEVKEADLIKCFPSGLKKFKDPAMKKI